MEAAHENRNMFTLKSLHDSMLIRNHIIQRFEHALVETDPLRRENYSRLLLPEADTKEFSSSRN